MIWTRSTNTPTIRSRSWAGSPGRRSATGSPPTPRSPPLARTTSPTAITGRSRSSSPASASPPHSPAPQPDRLPDVQLHDLRHAALALAAQSGATLAEVMRRAGHSSSRAAMIYQHAAERRDAEVAVQLGCLAAGTTPPRTGTLRAGERTAAPDFRRQSSPGRPDPLLRAEGVGFEPTMGVTP